MANRTKLLFLTIAGAALAMSGAAQAQTSHTKVFTFMTPDQGIPAAGDTVGWARLHRSSGGARLTLKTSQLGPGAAYSIWWIIFNNPKACGDDGCSDADFGTAEVEASVLNATGRVANDDGRASFSAFLPAGFIHTNPSGDVRHAFGPGLQNVSGAEIHIVVRCHGESSGSPEQISTLFADCVVPGSVVDETTGERSDALVCFDAQAAVFPLPRRRYLQSKNVSIWK